MIDNILHNYCLGTNAYFNPEHIDTYNLNEKLFIDPNVMHLISLLALFMDEMQYFAINEDCHAYETLSLLLYTCNHIKQSELPSDTLKILTCMECILKKESIMCFELDTRRQTICMLLMSLTDNDYYVTLEAYVQSITSKREHVIQHPILVRKIEAANIALYIFRLCIHRDFYLSCV